MSLMHTYVCDVKKTTKIGPKKSEKCQLIYLYKE